MSCRLTLIIIASLLCTSCAKKQANDWDTIDYSRIARERQENDRGYVMPAVPTASGCVDDDLYNCGKGSYGR